VTRDGENITVPAEEVTIGDLVQLKSGDRIPADVRIVFAQNFKVIKDLL
jgi:sodium/potassium-transporting ATPase subunit alpha